MCIIDSQGLYVNIVYSIKTPICLKFIDHMMREKAAAFAHINIIQLLRRVHIVLNRGKIRVRVRVRVRAVLLLLFLLLRILLICRGPYGESSLNLIKMMSTKGK